MADPLQADLFHSLADAFVVIGVSSQRDLEPLAPLDGDTSLPYKPSVLDTLPESMATSNTVRDLALFCMPSGVRLSETPGSPEAFSLVLTDELGRRCYATCLRFNDTLPRLLPETEPADEAREAKAREDSTEQQRPGLRRQVSYRSVNRTPSLASSMADATFERNASTESLGDVLVDSSSAFPFMGVEDDETESVGHPLGMLGVDLDSQLRLRKEMRVTSNGVHTSGFVTRNRVAAEDKTKVLPLSMSLSALAMRKIAFASRDDAILHGSHLAFDSDDGTMSDGSSESSYVVVHKKLRQPKRNITLGSVVGGGNTASGSVPVMKKDSRQRSVSSKSDAADSSLFATKCLCITSRYPLFDFFSRYLEQIYAYASMEHKRACLPLELYISSLLTEVPLPPLGLGLRLVVHGPLGPLKLPASPLRDLPHLGVPLEPLFDCLDRRNVILVLFCMLLEKKILFLSSDTSLLCVVSHALSSLMYPFSWEHVFIPTLPHALVECTEAPTPYIMGLDMAYRSWLDDTASMVLVNLDCNQVEVGSADPLPDLPVTLVEELVTDLREHVHPQLQTVRKVQPYPRVVPTWEEQEATRIEHARQIRLLFLRFFVQIFGTFRTYIVHSEDAESHYHQQQFLSAQPEEHEKFLDQFMDTQAFQIFIEKQVTGQSAEFVLFNEFAICIQRGESMEALFPTMRNRSASLLRSRSTSGTNRLQSTSETSISIPKSPSASLSRSSNDVSNVSALSKDFSLMASKEKADPALVLALLDPKTEKSQKVLLLPTQFPNLSDKRSLRAPRRQALLKQVDALLKSNRKCAQLHLVRAQILTSLFVESIAVEEGSLTDSQEVMGNRSYIIDAVRSLSESFVLDNLYYDRKMDQVQCILDLLTGKELKQLSCEPLFAKLLDDTKEKIYSRQVPVKPPAQDSKPDLASPVRDKVDIRASDGWLPQAVVETQSPASFAIPSKGLSECKFRAFLKEYSIVSKQSELDRLAEAMPRSHKKPDMVPARAIYAFLKNLQVAQAELETWKSNYASLMEMKEHVVYATKASTFDGRKGNLILTDKRLIFQRKGKKTGGIPLSSIKNTTRFNYHIYVPPGLPCLKVFLHDQAKPFIFSFRHFGIRDLWGFHILELLSANIMTRDLRDKRILCKARHNVFLSNVLMKDKHRKLFHFFGIKYPTGGWFRFSTFADGILNTHVIQEEEVEHSLSSIELLLRSVACLFFEHVNQDGESVDFASIREDKRWTTFYESVCMLQKFDMMKLSGKERMIAFAQIYNILVLHALVFHGRFPSSLWDWRYMERTAYYTISGTAYCLGDIHHGVLRGNKPPSWEDEPVFSLNDGRREIHETDEDHDARFLFTLAQHNESSPSMYTLNPGNLDQNLQRAADFYCQQHVTTCGNKITLPKLMLWYRSDMGGSEEAVLRYILKFLTPGQQKDLSRVLASGDYSVEYKQSWSPCPQPFFSLSSPSSESVELEFV